ncbi:MAG: nicotinate-nucleotide--dimethylbenzimidazole phosphoribosyltransferase [Actinomycetota bacterium]
MNSSISSIADIRALLAALPGPDQPAAAAWAARDPMLTKPPGALGRLEELSCWLAAWQGRHPPRLDTPRVRVFAGNHGVAALGVSAFPAEVTVQMVANFERGGAAINQLCATFGAELKVTALELDRPTADFTKGPALTEAEFVSAFRAGYGSVPAGTDLLALGEMGIGNTTPAAAIPCALFGGEAADWTGRGTGVAGAALARKTEVVAEGVARHRGQSPLDVLRCLGGRELAAIAGAVLAARLARVPVLLDGYVCTAAAAPLEAERPGALDHCQVGHCSAEPGHRRLVDRLGKRALLDLDMRLGEASGAALAIGVLKGAVACHAGMATFGEAGVSEKQ